MPLHPAIRLDNLGWIRRSRKNLSYQRVRVQRNRRHQLLQFFGRRVAGRSRRLFVGLVLRTVGLRSRGELHQQTAEQRGQNLFHQFNLHGKFSSTTRSLLPTIAPWVPFLRAAAWPHAIVCGLIRRVTETRRRRVRDIYLFEEPGGNFLNIFSTPLSRFLMFLSELLESVSLAFPLQISCLVLVSKRSTTTVPTLYVSVVVVASPKPPPPKRLQPQPPPIPL